MSSNKIPTARPFPYRSISLELTSLCNLRCPLCPHTVAQRDKRHVPTESAIRWIREIRRSRLFSEVCLVGYGESMLHPGIIDCVRICRLRTGGLMGIRPVISTNGCYRVSNKAIIEAGLSRMIFSLDGFTQSTYEKYRVNGDLARAKANLLDLKKHAGRRCAVIWQMIGFDWIPKSEVQQARQFCRQHGIVFEYKHTKRSACEAADRLKVNAGYDRKYGADNPLNPKYRFCQTPLILHTGEVAMCCRDYHGKASLGNIDQTPLAEILDQHRGTYAAENPVCARMCPHLKGDDHD